MLTDTYKKTLNQLNPAQKEAVETIDGPVMVVAGPGTGKTHVLAARIAQILERTDTPPYAILALTYTDSAAVNMRNRVVKMIGKAGYYVQIMTFHAFCSDIIKTHPEFFPIDRASQPLSDLEKYELFQTLIQEAKIENLKPLNMPLFYLRDIIQSISQLKREGILPTDFKEAIEEEFSETALEGLKKTELRKRESQKLKNLDLLYLYENYQKTLRERQRYDFDDMITFVVEAFKTHELLLREYQEQLHYFLIDEYQDTNSAQNAVVFMLARYWGEQANLFVVGDPNQSIFRFQGASIENSLNFVKAYPDAKIITLDTGYRGTQVIYDAAHAVISENKLTHETDKAKLKSTNKDKDLIHISILPAQTLELVYIAEEIKRLLAEGEKPEDVSILYRNNSDVIEIQHVLEKWGIPYEIDGGENILEAEMIRQLIQLMFVVRDIRLGISDERLFEIMSYDWTAIQPILAMKVAQAAGKAKTSIVELVQSGYENFIKYYTRNDVTAAEFQEIEKFISQLEQWVIDDGKLVFTQWFELLLQQSGYLDYILTQENKIELLTNLNSFFREIKALIADKKDLKLTAFLDAISTMKDNRISIYAEDLNVEKGVVHLSTAHKAKGREWKYVFLMNAIDGAWGNSRFRELIQLPASLLQNTDISKKERNEDDRRLFYVVLTRARKRLYLTYSKSIISGHRSRQVSGSMFIEEIPEDLKKVEEPTKVSEMSHEHIITIIKPRTSPTVKVTDEAFFQELVSRFKLSVTALNSYLRDTDEFVRNNLLKVPRAKLEHMAFGTAVHYALEKFNKVLMEANAPTKQQLLGDFEIALKNELLSSEDFDRRMAFGKSILAQYFDTYSEQLDKPIFVERFFGYGFGKTMLGDIPLVGRIDKISLLDAKEKLVSLTDYKTGSPKSHNEIEGKTASVELSEREQLLPESIRGPYKRQLLFYKLLTQLDKSFPYTATEGIFDFVQPDKQSGKLIQRSFTLKDEDVQDLRELIKEVMKEIRELKFLKAM